MTIPVNQVIGIGPKTTDYLKTKRVTTAEGLIKFGVEKLALAPGFNPGRAETVMKAADSLLGNNTSTKKGVAKKTQPKKAAEKNKKKEAAKKDSKKDKKKDKKNKKNKKDKKKNKKDKKGKNK